MKHLYISLFAVLFAFITTKAGAQSFSVINTSLENVAYSEASWGDIDGDCDLDVVLTGVNTNDEIVTKIFENIDGSFAEIPLELPAVENGSAKFGDYDQDGDQDILITGLGQQGPAAYILENLGNNNFVDAEAGLPGVENGKSAWGDYDNDGDLDVLLTGNWDTFIYRNDDGIFVDIGEDFGYFNSSCAAWGDCDNDGDLDLLLSGDSGAGPVSKLFRNDEGDFFETDIPLYGTMAGVSGFVDFDNDTDMDIYVSGFNSALEPVLRLFINDGEGGFTQDTYYLSGASLTGLDWGDFDNDGDQDMVIVGKGAGCGLYIGRIYRNDGDFFTDIGAGINSFTRGSANWGDYDNDGDLDLLLTGYENDASPRTKLYQNSLGSNTYSLNTPPTVPSGLTALQDGDDVELSWDPSEDEQTFAFGLSYNLMIGTEPDMMDIQTAMADPETGVRQIAETGNAGQNNSWLVKNLVPGTYYWKVQAIDHSYCGSDFSESGEFTLVATGIDEFGNTFPELVFVNDENKLIVNVQTSAEKFIRIIDINGREVKRIESDGMHYLSDLQKGVYVVVYGSEDSQLAEKIIVE
ncbi:MAG: FG-GAP-like repeat-containing protein [Bacteroidales bacterium]|nr:FG-GAP-like repeat-containing protein [Bacteroidales bacterium]MCF8343686.1 FG-GAP-like repeat-containing protein [Bacteroidales bacterium]MCF8351670.1 FG-GAP-like repeat-containing protein [Bacteroidales bacterium]MCF8374755.1 FG-GAP-like repeat-containing protein [Bacteroidales bacterium]MCF8399841.1 FG-GAP-like repeat-containing protein [Bacteroidales bacterium]